MRAEVAADPAEADLLTHLSNEPKHVDDIVRDVMLAAGQVTSLLTLMELKGLVRQVGPLRYVRAS